MAGHMEINYELCKIWEVVKSDLANNLIYLKGSIPGSKKQQFI